MKKIGKIIILFVLITLLASLFWACKDEENKNKNTRTQIPIYQGMTIKTRYSWAYNAPPSEELPLPSPKPAEMPGPAHRPDPHNDHVEELPQEIEEIVQIDVVTDDEIKYYVYPNEVFIIEVHIDNPNDYEIQSFTLNGKKYANYMFKEGSTMELLLLEVTAPSTSGYTEYSIDAIKYIDGTEIKDVDMSSGNKTIKAGISYTSAPTASVTKEEISTTSISLDITVFDYNDLIGNNELSLYLSDGEKVVASKALKVGENSVVFNNLIMSTVYEYGVITAFDLIDGRDTRSEWLLTKEFSTFGAYRISNVEATQDTIAFDVGRTGEVGAIDAISLYDANTNELVQTGTAETRSFSGLLSNHTYNLYVDFSYPVNEETVTDWVGERGIRTIAKAVPTLAIENVEPTQTSFTYVTTITDTDSVGAITKIELLHGNDEPVSVENLNSREFTSLLSNNDYSVRVTYTYDLNDGAGNQTIVQTANTKTIAKAVPTLEIENLVPTQTSFTYVTTITDTDNVGSITKIELLHGNDEPISVEDLTSREFTSLLSNNNYSVRVAYTYDLNDGAGNQTIVQTASTKTIAKAVPTLAIENVEPTQTSFTYVTTITDTDSVGAITKIELLHGNDEPISVENLNSREFTSLLSNNDYSVRVTYTYDLNDGAGNQTIVQTANVKTVAKVAPVVSASDFIATKTQIDCTLSYVDVDSIGTITDISLYNGTDKVQSTSERTSLSFTTLQSGILYTLSVQYSYDLNDGTGIHNDTYTVEYPTLVDSIAVEEIILLNNNVVKSGEELNMRIYFTNPSEIEMTAIYVNGQQVNVVGGDRVESAIIKFIPNEIGLIDFFVDKVDYVFSGHNVSQRVDSDVSVQYPIFGDLDVTFTPVTSLYYDLSGNGTYLAFENEHNYTVYKINDSEDFYTFTNGQYYIYNNNVSSIEYGYDNYGHTTQTFTYSYERTANVGTDYKKVSTAEDFLTMTSGYYYLTDDIDMRNITLTSQINFTGVLVGNGHKIRGLHNVVDTSKVDYYNIFTGECYQDYNWSTYTYYYRYSGGSFYDVQFTELYISVNGTAEKQVNILPFGGARLINCSVKGDVLGNEYVTVIDIYGIDNSTSYNYNVTLSGVMETKKYTATNTLQKNENVEITEDGTIYYTFPNGKKYLFGTFNTELTVLNISEDVAVIGNGAFKNCNLLTEINMSENTLCGDALGSCPLIKATMSIQALNGLPLETKASLQELTVFGKGSIGYACFYDWGSHTFSIQKVIIKNGVTSIEDYAFENCSSLTSITIPDSVTSIWDYAFCGCSNLTSITIPSSVTSIGNCAFDNCSNLTGVYYAGDIASWCGISFNNMYSNPLYYAHKLYINNTLITEIDIPNTVTEIKPNVFMGWNGTSITIPDGVTSIGYQAFYGCSSLTSITFPDGVTSIGERTFYDCRSLTSITIPDNVTNIGYQAFYGCSSLTSITIPDGVTSIGDYAFYNCSGLTSITIPDSVTSIGNWTFYGCSSLTSITIPSSVTSIGNCAFDNCSNLTGVYYAGDIASWCGISFNNYSSNPLCYAHNLYINSELISEITIPNTVTVIKNNTFRDCYNITSVIIPDSVTSIGDAAFYYCGNLTTVTISTNMTSIGKNAFYGCNSLQTIYYGGTQENKGNISLGNGNDQLSSATWYYYAEEHPTVSGNYWYYKNDVVTIGAPGEHTYSNDHTCETRVCTICGYVCAPLTDHVFDENCQCTVCGKIIHNYINGVCSRCGDNIQVPIGALQYNGHTYYLYTEQKSWTEAEAYCESIGGHLATITSSEENDFLTGHYNGHYYLGGSDNGTEGDWRWITGETWDYTNWNSGEPNGSTSENYLTLWGGTSWNDISGNSGEVYGFVCEWDFVTK